jgi:hypothetical protein
MSLCVFAGGKTIVLTVAAFTLAWTHSVEKTQWEEDWRVVPAGLEIVTARVRGSGAGMEPPSGAVLADGWWVYSPVLPPVPELVLAASGATSGGWSLCAGGACSTIGATPDAPLLLRSCGDAGR